MQFSPCSVEYLFLEFELPDKKSSYPVSIMLVWTPIGTVVELVSSASPAQATVMRVKEPLRGLSLAVQSLRLSFRFKERGFHLWSGNQDPTRFAVRQKNSLTAPVPAVLTPVIRVIPQLFRSSKLRSAIMKRSVIYAFSKLLTPQNQWTFFLMFYTSKYWLVCHKQSGW